MTLQPTADHRWAWPRLVAMRLFFDARFTRMTHHDGISRYGASLLTSLLELTAGTDVDVTAIIHDDRQLALLPEVESVKLNSPLSPAELWIGTKLNRLGADVVFSPMQVMGSWPRDYKLILTIHDLIYYSHPLPPRDLPAPVRGLWRLYHKAHWPQRLLLDRADAVAAVSETTARLLAEQDFTSRPVTVIRNAAVPPAEPPQRSSGHDARTLVYMGSFLPYKNVDTLVQALHWLPGWTLHLASGITAQIEARLRSLTPDCARVVFHRGISDADYQQLLDRATALVMPSLDEGFGLPVVEAMSRGVPVALSDIPVFHELADGVAEFFDPHDPEAVAAAVLRFADAKRWQDAAQAGRRQAETFSWERSAQQLLDLAHRLMNDKHAVQA